MTVVGLLLAAGAGRRMGRPKALVVDDDGAWLPRATRVLLDGGCSRVVVVLGAGAVEARALLASADEAIGDAEPVEVVVAPDWEQGQSASLRAGLAALLAGSSASATPDAGARTDTPSAALVHLVDLPDVGPDVVRRLVAEARPDLLRRAVYAGVPGHPVLLGRAHWRSIAAAVEGDRGARDYLDEHAGELERVECGDLAGGGDVDHMRP
ncbi:NTP transferase domain-containing protein [Nocardioides sp. R-C-SC26]|uniref:nucleotidyltransferase family protein n=1 Tax=Nocardioides sp. R-C-SC26 TaxID=2870414 RepID=UPI001E311C20|nr:NTP transferase domain-containing protein [Nocardioides sp. R-C-SC26]